MPKHAKLSASGAELWLNCPGSVHMAELFPETTSPAAAEGTLAHALAQTMILSAGQDTLSPVREAEYRAERDEVNSFYSEHKGMEGSFDGMKKILEPYVDYVIEEFQTIQKKDPAAELMTEQHVDFSDIVPGGFGTSDVVIIGADICEVIDLKYGKGVPVSAINNPQIRLYTYGTMAAFDLSYDFSKVKMVIYQPRLDSVTSEELSAEDLRSWGKAVIVPAAKRALSKSPKYNPGPWCKSHFCPAAGSCKARAAKMHEFEEMLKRRQTDKDLLSGEEMGKALSSAREYTAWAKDLETEALAMAQEGQDVTGWKVVESVSKRKYKSEEIVAATLVKAGYDPALLYEKKLLGLTKMTQLVGKKDFKKLLEDPGLVYKPEGSPTLAPESDKRPAIVTTVKAEDFDD
jgi:hypothetical protein